MSRAKLFNMIKSRGEQPVGRNPFDLTNRHVYTSKIGKITPVKAIHTYPDDYLEVEMSEFSQNNIPMNTAAFVAGKKEMLAYFVPYNSVWHNFNQYQATREDPDSTLLKDKGISYEPRIELFKLYSSAMYFACGAFLFNKYVDILTLSHIINMVDSPVTLTDGMTASEIVELCKATPHPDRSDVDVWTYYHNSTYWNMRNNYDFAHFVEDNNFLFNVEFHCYEYSVLHKEDLSYFDTISNIVGNLVWCDWVQKMDMFGYGNIYPTLYEMMLKLDAKVDDICSSSVLSISGDTLALNYTEVGVDDPYVINTNSFNPYLESNIPIFKDMIQDYMDVLVNMTSYVGDDHARHYEYVNLYPIYGYNKCFYDYMRNSYFDLDYSVYNYNCDFVNGLSIAGSIISRDYIPLRWYHIESHQWKKDMFTGVLPDNQFGSVSSLVLDASQLAITNTVTGSPEITANDLRATSPIYAEAPSNFIQPNGTVMSDGAASFFYVSGNNTRLIDVDNHEAQVRTAHSHEVGGTLTVGPGSLQVTSSVSGDSAVLNVLALKRAEAIQQYRQDLMRAGNRTQDIFKQIYGTTPKSTLDETPYFIDVASNDINVNPIISTAQTGQELNGKLGDIAARSTISGGSLSFKFSTKDFGVVILLSYIVPESFYNSTRLDPFVTHLDQEAHGLPYFQNLGLQPVLGEYLCNTHGHDARMRSHGFAPPYIERKTDIDLCHGNLVDASFVESGVQDVNYQGSMSHWVVARTDMQQEKTLTLRSFYINPRIMDNVFTFNADDTYETDHYLTYASIKVNAVRGFSEIGLPRF